MKIRLGEIVEEFSQKNRNLQCKNVYSVTNSGGFILSNEYFSKDVYSKDLSNYKIVEKGMIAYNPSRINVGSVSCLNDEKGIISPLYVVIKPEREKVTGAYLNFFLHSPYAKSQIKNLTSGSVRDSLSFTAFKKILIDLPCLNEQNEIINKLEKINNIVFLFNESYYRLNNSVKSRFLENNHVPNIVFSEVVA